MPDADKELKIRITTAADISGLKQTTEALKEVSDAAKKSPFLHAEDAPGAGPLPAIAGDSPIAAGDQPPPALPRVENVLLPALSSIAEAARLLLIAAGALDGQLSQLSSPPEAARPVTAAGAFNPSAADSHSADAGDEDARAAASDDSPGFSPANPVSDSLQLGRQLSGDQAALLNSLAALLQVSRDSLRETLALVRDGLRDQAALREEVGGLRRAVAQLGAGRANAGVPTPP